MLPNHPYEVFNHVPMTVWKELGQVKIYLVHTEAEFAAFFTALMRQKIVFCDTETSGFHYFKEDRIVGSSFGWGDTHFYIPCRHVDSWTGGEQPTQLTMDFLRPYYQEFFAQKDISTVWHNCMHKDSEVLLADGTYMKIDKMVKEKHPGPVMTVNEETGQLEAKPILNWLKGDLRDNSEWVQIRSTGKGHINCTNDHEVITARGRVEAQDVVPGDKVYTTLNEFSEDHKQFLLGTLLGDASITKLGASPSISVAHANEEFSLWKADLFGTEVKEVSNQRGFSSHKEDAVLYRTRMPNDVRLQEVYELVTVDDKKQLNEEWISQLKLPAIAAWYCDDGWLEQGKYPKIVLSLDKALEAYLLDQLSSLGFSPSIWWRNETVANITLQASDLSLLAPYVPSCMWYKLPHKYRAQFVQWAVESSTPFMTTVESVSPLFKKDGRRGLTPRGNRTREYCIAVEGNRNFFVGREGGMSVSNCKFDIHFYRADDIKVHTWVHDTRILWQLFNENAPGALKVIASGWRDIFGRKVDGILDNNANVHEKEISRWRTEEARQRRKELTKLVKATAEEYKTKPKYQDWKKNDLKKWLKEEFFKDHDLQKNGKEDVHYGYVPIPTMTKYAGMDTFITQKLFYYILERMPLEGKIAKLYNNEMALCDVIMRCEEHGICVDRPYLEKMALDYESEIATLAAEIDEELKEFRPEVPLPKRDGGGTKKVPVNINSPAQLGTALVGYGVPLRKKKPDSPNWVTDKKALTKHSKRFPVCSKILDYRRKTKLKGTYFDAILQKLIPGDILHANFNQNVSTGRMSSNDPNLQNQPRGNAVRNAFIVPKNYVYLFADYSQIEVRLTAHYSQDPILLDSYRRKQDVHCRTAGTMFGVSYDEMVAAKHANKETATQREKLLQGYRNIGKTLNFGLIYGVSAIGLSEQIPRPEQYSGLSDEAWVMECERFIKTYFRAHMGVKRFINKYSRLVKKDCQLENGFGRIRHLPHAQACKVMNDHELEWLERRAQRQGVNFLIQGEAGDLFKTAVVRVDKVLQGTRSNIVNFVHDEIQMYLHMEELHLVNQIRREMENFQYSVPIVADFEYSMKSWGQKEEL